MKRAKRMVCMLFAICALSASTGCSVSAGWTDGLNKGVSSAVQAFFTAALAQPLADMFPKPQ